LSVQGRSESSVGDNEPQLTVNLLTGTGGHFVYSGTFTLSESEWHDLVEALEIGLGGRLEIAVGPLGGNPLEEPGGGGARGAT
jgi:hypothetical protein